MLQKNFYSNQASEYINDWIINFKSSKPRLGNLFYNSNDFQHQNFTYLSLIKDAKSVSKLEVTVDNIKISAIYFTVRLVENATWLNDRDQFLYPNDGWKKDTEFQNDCLAYALFHGQNKITSNQGLNHWIPFTEQAVEARDGFASHFMTDFMSGKAGDPLRPTLSETSRTQNLDQSSLELFGETGTSFIPHSPLVFSQESQAVFAAGRGLWRYYHAVSGLQNGDPNGVKNYQSGTSNGDTVAASETYNPNASLYDIREYFQGRNAAGKMNNKSLNIEYTRLIGDLRDSAKVLGLKIQPKVYEFGFLRQ